MIQSCYEEAVRLAMEMNVVSERNIEEEMGRQKYKIENNMKIAVASDEIGLKGCITRLVNPI